MSPRYAANVQKLREAQEFFKSILLSDHDTTAKEMADLWEILSLCDYVLAAKNLKKSEFKKVAEFKDRVRTELNSEFE